MKSMTLVKLREKAKEKGMKNISTLKKSELIEALKEHDLKEKKSKVYRRQFLLPIKKKKGSIAIQNLNSSIVVRPRKVFLRCCRMDMGLFDAIIIFPVRMTYMYPLRKLEDLTLKPVISLWVIQE